MKHRVFVAIRASRKLQEEVAAWVSSHAKLPVRWISPENLHITLVPPWYEEDTKRIANAIAGALADEKPFTPYHARNPICEDGGECQKIAKRSTPRPRLHRRDTGFTIEFNAASYGPAARNPRLIWATGTAPAKLSRLAKKLHRALGVPLLEKREFQLHLTLARFRHETFLSFPSATFHEPLRWVQTVNAVELMESHLSPSGAQYETLARFPFPRSA
jgi:2'-5' RNA ligase